MIGTEQYVNDMQEISTTINMLADRVRQMEAIEVPHGTVPTGEGNAGEVTYWAALNTITGDTGLTYNGVTNTIGVLDNLADALSIADAGGITYAQIVSTNAQPVMWFNPGAVDVDFRIAALGVADAFFVRGDIGYVGVGVFPGVILHTLGGTTVLFNRHDAGTNNIAPVNTLTRTSSDVVDDGFGIDLRFILEDDGGVNRQAANIYVVWSDVSADESYMAFHLRDGATSEKMRLTHQSRLGIRENNPGAQLHVQTSSAAVIGQIIRGTAAQAAPLQEWQDSTAEKGVAISPDAKELRWYDPGASHYVGFEAPALTANQIWVLPDADGNDGDVMFTDGGGNLKWGANASVRAFTFSSPSGGSGTIYAGGHYRFGTTDNDFNPSITFGAVDAAYGDHIFIVAAAGGAGGTDTVIRVTGTSVTDAGVRSAADTEDLTADDAGAAGAYYETTKKWIGRVTIEKVSGPDLLCNYGGTKYWDDNNEDFKIEGVEVTWLGGANDANPNLLLRHHKATGWTYNNGSTPTPPTAIATMNTDYVTEIEIVNGEEGAWKRTNLSVNIAGSGSEGMIIEVITTANKAVETGNFLVRVVPQ